MTAPHTFSDGPPGTSDAAAAAERPAVAAISSAPHPACAANDGGGSPLAGFRAAATQSQTEQAPARRVQTAGA